SADTDKQGHRPRAEIVVTPNEIGGLLASSEICARNRRKHMNPMQLVPIPSDINRALRSAKNSTMLQILGRARDTFDHTCRPATNNPIRALLATEDVGQFSVTGIKPAIDSLREVLAPVKNAHPEVHDVLGTAGMFCARLIAGSQSISNHSWGTAVDIRVGSVL